MTRGAATSATALPDADLVATLNRLLHAERRIDTQAARVFLAADRAWKVKRPIDIGFLDFSTPARRRAALEAELKLNRRTAPDLYLGVHALTREESGDVVLEGSGEVVEWLLEMRRFPDDALLDHYAEEGMIDPGLLVALADRIADLHARSEPFWEALSDQDLTDVIESNAKRFAATATILDPEIAHRLCDQQHRCLDRWRDRLAARAARGRVRLGHGDLHLNNIAIIDGQPLLFDCLEFDEKLATTDVAYDLAFLLMDLCHKGLEREANILFNRYLDISPEDEDAAALMPLFLSLRASVRAHVLATRAMDGDKDSATAALSYLDLALRLLTPAPARLLAIGGLSGTGKSTLARALGADFGPPPGARILRSDVLRKRAAGLRPEQHLPRSCYTAQAARRSYQTLIATALQHLDDGTNVIVDAAFQERAERNALAEAVEKRPFRLRCLWLTTDPQRRFARVAARRDDASDADVEVARSQPDVGPTSDENWQRIDATATPDRVAATAARLVVVSWT